MNTDIKYDEFLDIQRYQEDALKVIKALDGNPCREIMFNPGIGKIVKPKSGTVRLLDECTDGIHPSYEPYYYFDLVKERIPMNSGQIDTTPHSQRVNPQGNYGRPYISVEGPNLSGKLNLTDEKGTLRVELPGIKPDLVEITQIDNLVRVRVHPESKEFDVASYSTPKPRELHFYLTAEETIVNSKLALGVLTITIDRGRVVKEITVDAE